MADFTADPIGDLFRAFVAGEEALAEARAQAQERRRNDPQVRAARTASALKGWRTRNIRAAAEQAQQDADEAEEAARWTHEQERRGSGPWCDEMGVHPVAGEVFCILGPGHGGEHEDVNDIVWED